MTAPTNNKTTVPTTGEAWEGWITLEVERALYVDRGRDAIACDRNILGPSGGTLIVKLKGSPASPAPQAWRTIESAPRDGTPIEAWRPQATFGRQQQRVEVKWFKFTEDDNRETWIWPCEPQADILKDDWLEDGDFYESTEFTHWRALPLPPASGEGT